MSKIIIALLFITNAVTGWELVKYRGLHQELSSNQTSDQEREMFGSACLDWLTEEIAKDEYDGLKLMLARSWKKHGQLVFEIVPSEETAEEVKSKFTRKDWEGVLCTYDKQSGTMFSHSGDERERWMFYE